MEIESDQKVRKIKLLWFILVEVYSPGLIELELGSRVIDATRASRWIKKMLIWIG